MNKTRILFFCVMTAAVAAAGLLIVLAPRSGDAPAAPAISPVISGAIDVPVASATTKQQWIDEAAARFNAAAPRTANGRPFRIVPAHVLSGGSMQDIIKGKLRPVAWSPGAESWVQELDAQWRQRTGGTLSSSPCRPTIMTPLGIAMWRPMAEALGWPSQKVGWKTIIDLAENPDGWGSLGHPEWGQLKLGYPHPGYSNVGMLFLASVIYGIKGKTANLEPAEVYGNDVRVPLTALAMNTSKYGMVSLDLLDAMTEQGPQFLHAVAAFENDTVRYNREHADRLRFPLAFIAPAEGTFWTDQPYCVFDKADWVTPEQAEGARAFLAYLLDPNQQALAMTSALRPLDGAMPLTEPLNLANGTDPGVKPGTIPSLQAPSGEVLRAIVDIFLTTKRKATVLVVLDASGSMSGEKIRTATAATENFLKRLHPQDIVGLESFNDSINFVSTLRPVAEIGEKLQQVVGNLIADGGTSLYAATCQGIKTVEAQRRSDVAAGLNRLYGVVLLSDGQDTSSRMSANEMMSTCLPQGPEMHGVRIFPIAFGSDADTTILDSIAKATGGRMLRADPESIERIYLSLSAEQ
jgi:Ca-activated chloride channel family protein